MGAAALPQTEGQGFYLVALTETQTLIEPAFVHYTEGQTIKQALLASGYRFDALEQQGYISGVEGVVDNFRYFYDENGYDLSVPASSVTVFCIVTQEERYSPELLDLLRLMGEYNGRTDGVKNYTPAKTAYANALSAICATSENAAALLGALQSAIADFEAIINGEKASVTFTVKQGAQTVSDVQITMTDAYGIVTTATGTGVAVAPGDYIYSVSDGGRNRAEGTVKVEATGAAVSVELPSGVWVQSVDIGKKSGAADYYPKEMAEDASATYYLPDTTRETSQAYLYAVQGPDVPSATTTRLRTLYTGVDGTDYSKTNRSWSSNTIPLANMVQPGMAGRTFEVVAYYEPAGKSYVMIQSYGVEVVRTPTLAALAVSGEGTVLPLDFSADAYNYILSTVSSELVLSPVAFGSYGSGYSVKVNGADVAENGTATVALNDGIRSGDGSYTIAVSAEYADARGTEYTIHVNKMDSVEVTVNRNNGTSVSVFNAANAEITAVNGNQYRMVPGETYTYIATRGAYYHTTATFTAAQGLAVTAAEPIEADWLTEIAAASSTAATSKTRLAYPADKSFSSSVHEYTYEVSDCNASFALWATKLAAEASVTITARYTQLSTGAARSATVTSGASAGVSLSGFAEVSGCGNTMTLRVARPATGDGVVVYQEYILHAARTLHAYDMYVQLGSEKAVMQRDATPTINGFDRDILDYTIEVPKAAQSVSISLLFPTTAANSLFGGYTALLACGQNSVTVQYDHQKYLTADVALDSSKNTETLTVTMQHPDTGAISQVYTVTVKKLPAIQVTFNISPADAVLFLAEDFTGRRVLPEEDGSYQLLQGYSYSYTVTRSGYVGQSGTFIADGEREIDVALAAAVPNPFINTAIVAQWGNFRGNNENNAVTSVPAPVKDEDAALYWANKLGDGYGANAVGSPILVDGFLYTYAGNTVFKVDTISGKTVASGTMDHSSSFSITPPTYAEGMIFIALSNGYVQAFNAETLESLWLYHDALSGQPNTPITYYDGYIYTGFWNSETRDANFVCLSITDEDPGALKESKLPTWTYRQPGGFYWAGAYVADGFVLVGTDDGESGYTTGYGGLLSLDPKTGVLLDSLTMPHVGDVRSMVCYDTATNAYYFTSKGGYFYQVRMNADGTIAENSLRGLAMDNGGNNPATPPMSTSTPVVHNGRAYIGVSGTSQFGAYSGHNITVIDLATWSRAYSVATQGYPQTSGLLTTAYDEGDGTAYVYFLDNMTPGILRVLKDRPGQTQPEYTQTESYVVSGATYTAETPHALFTPYGAQAQYAICSPIVDEYGTLYFKNDSAYLMAVGSTIESLEIATPPSKTQYAQGERFDPAGMTVLAHYTNGQTRDVTEYISFNAEALSADDEDFEIRFEHMMYQNAGGEAGSDVTPPYATIQLTVGEQQPGDVNGDGTTDASDALLIVQHYTGLPDAQLTEQQLKAADINGDGFVDALDSLAILQAMVA